GGRRVTITLTRGPEGVRGSRLENPLRLEIDVDGPQAEAGGEKRFPLADEVVSGVRAAPRAGGLSVVLDLKRDPGPSDVRAEGVEWTASTQFVGLTPEALVPGAPVEAAGRLSAPAHLVAATIEKAKPGRGEILGAVTAEERRSDGSIALTILGVEVIVPAGVPTR